MTKNELKLFQLLLKYAVELMSNKICNDLTDEMKDCLSKEEWDKLAKEMHILNGDPEMFYPGECMPDWLTLWALSKKLNL